MTALDKVLSSEIAVSMHVHNVSIAIVKFSISYYFGSKFHGKFLSIQYIPHFKIYTDLVSMQLPLGVHGGAGPPAAVPARVGSGKGDACVRMATRALGPISKTRIVTATYPVPLNVSKLETMLAC